MNTERCQACHAVVNPAWKVCAACHGLLTTEDSSIKPVEAIQPGNRITWERAGVKQIGVVDYLHTDADGNTWAFVSIGDNWAAVNFRFVTVTAPGSTTQKG